MEPSQQSSSVAIPIAIVFGFGLIALAIYFSGIGGSNTVAPTTDTVTKTTKSNIKPVDKTDYIYGNPNAPILVVEYSDYDCPFCKNFHETMNQIMNEYGVTGKVAWVYRQFPIAGLHPNANHLSESALCVGELGGNDAFWKYSNSIFQERNVNEATNISKLKDYAKNAGVEESAFQACLDSGKHKKTVEDSLAEGASAGIEGTPHSFVLVGNQQAAISGAQPYPVVKNIVENLIGQLEGKDVTASTTPTE
jgi:protein-disulfide isomerase